MANALRQGTTKFTMRKDAERAALRALRDAHEGASFSVDKDDLERAKTLDEALAAFGWRLLRSSEGNVRGIHFEGEDYQGNEEALFDALAPYVEPASVIDLWFDEAPKRFKFTGQTLVERRIKPDAFRDYEEEDEAPPPSRIPDFKDALRGAPASRRPYAPSATFGPGEWLEHSKFGPGLVLKSGEPGKVRVLFADGERTLLQGR